MIITYKDIRHIHFPAYIVDAETDNFYAKDGIVYVDGKVIDDKNMPGSLLGVRRLQTYFTDLYPLNKSVADEVALFKNKQSYYIDAEGKIFFYRKTKMVPLKYHKVRTIQKKEVACVVWFEDINFSAIVRRPPAEDSTWAGILYINNVPWKLYEFSNEKNPDTRRKI